MIRASALALGVALATVAAGSGDYELRTPTESIKAKSAQACEAGRQAIARGWIKSIPASTPTACWPHPGYFTPDENCIQGFNCPIR